MAWFRSPQYLEKADYERILLNTPLRAPGKGQYQEKMGSSFFASNRNIIRDWYNAYFNVEYRFEALADGANIANNAQTAPINGSFSLIKNLTLKSSGKPVYIANDVNKVIFIKTLLDYSDDYSRSVAKREFWYLDTDNTNVTNPATPATNKGIEA